jgi:hypothetical protein
MQNKGMYVALGAVLVVSLVTLISASIVYDPIRQMNDDIEKNPSNAAIQIKNYGPILKNAKNAGVLIIVGQLFICVAVIAAIVMGYKYGDSIKSQISKSLAMRYF